MNDDIRAFHPPVYGWLEKDLSQEEINFLWKCVDNEKEVHNSKLAGNIHLSKSLDDPDNWFFKNTLIPLCQVYGDTFGNVGDTYGFKNFNPYSLVSMWVNYQKKGEFNPLHDHAGVYSFVIWMKIPTEFEEQNQKPFAKDSKSPSVSGFQFIYNDILGNLTGQLYQLGKRHEGMMLFFPSKLHHQVYPFFDAEEDRISISGNIGFNF